MVITDFLDDLMPRLPGADEALVEAETLSALRQFCEEGLAWVYNYPVQTITALDTHIAINNIPANTSVGYLLLTEFKPNSSDEYKELYPALRLPTNPSDTATEPTHYYAESPSSLLLIPVPTETHTNGFRGAVSLVPTGSAVDLPDEFQSHWRDAVIDGVMYRMLTMVSKPWSNPQLSVIHGRKFRNAIKRARDITKRRYGTSSAAWRFPFFAAQ